MATKKKTPKKAAKKKTTAKKKVTRSVRASATGVEIPIRTVRFHCDGGNCKASPDPRHLNGGDLVVLFATNTGVTITFTGATPFISGSTQIQISKGGIDIEIVDDSLSGGIHFPYTLTCTKPLCGTLQNPPEMIVD
jgi:hypothetical protein